MMKRRISIGLAAAMTAAVLVALATPASAAPAGAMKVDLLASQSIDVGDVYIWNDATTLHVEYVLDAGWCMTESHLAVATKSSGIPQVKGNPIPGMFAYGEPYDPCASGDTFDIPLPVGAKSLVIAADAKVWDKSSLMTVELVSAPGAAVYGPQFLYYPPGDPAWGTTSIDAVEPSFAAANVWPTISGAQWISTETIEMTSPPLDSWRWNHAELTVPGLPVSGSVVTVTSDNAERVWANGAVIGSDGEVDTQFIDNQEWKTILDYPFMPKMGVNTLDFVWRNYGACTETTAYCAAPGLDQYTPSSNPTGLIYKVSASYLAHVETAWGAGAPFSGKNWATYIPYTVRDYVESISTGLYDVTANKGAWDCVTGVTDLSVRTASGITWQNLVNGDVRVLIDLKGAKASSTFDVWVEQNPGTCPPGTNTPSNMGGITTNASGDGRATITFTPMAGSVNFWLTLWTPPGPPYPGIGEQVLRAQAVKF
jgi:hypothetical protein